MGLCHPERSEGFVAHILFDESGNTAQMGLDGWFSPRAKNDGAKGLLVGAIWIFEGDSGEATQVDSRGISCGTRGRVSSSGSG